MPSFMTVLGSCLIAASAAVAADRPANPAGEPWWSNPPTASSPAAEPKAAEYPPAAARPGPRTTDVVRTSHVGQGAEFAPDPPGSQHHESLPAVFQQDFTSPLETPAAGAPANGPKPLDAALSATVRPMPQPAATASTASPMPPPTAAGSPAAAAPSSSAQQDPPTPLGLGSHSVKNAFSKTSPLGAVITVGSSLAIVLGLFLIVAWAMRKTAPRGSMALPKEVFEVLGRAPLGVRQQVQLLRCGNKLLLVSITPNGAETLTEVTDPLEVDRIAGICQEAHPKSATTAFRQVFQQVAAKADEPSELDDLQPSGTRRKRYRWEENHA